MSEEWVCDKCGYVGTGEGTCPECGNKLVSVGDYDDDLAKTDNKYTKDEIEVSVMDDDDEDEMDFVEDGDEDDNELDKVG